MLPSSWTKTLSFYEIYSLAYAGEIMMNESKEIMSVDTGVMVGKPSDECQCHLTEGCWEITRHNEDGDKVDDESIFLEFYTKYLY